MSIHGGPLLCTWLGALIASNACGESIYAALPRQNLVQGLEARADIKLFRTDVFGTVC